MAEIALEQLLDGLPPESDSELLTQIQRHTKVPSRKLVVLDDDPTGTQTVFGIHVLTTWTIPELEAELRSTPSAFFILTNSRSMSAVDAAVINWQIGHNLKIAARSAGREITVISRSDSTLRGHFPAETDALAEGLDTRFDGVVIAPYFHEGGRYTIDDVHYVFSGGKALPIGRTEFAKDPVFGFSQSNLCSWVQEKTRGRITAEEVVSISIQEIRTGKILLKLRSLNDGQVCIINAACDSDIERVALATILAEQEGKRFLFRTAASFVRARAGIPNRPLLSTKNLVSGTRTGGLVVVGSIVPRTNDQLTTLRKKCALQEIELDVHILQDRLQREKMIEDLSNKVDQAISVGEDVLLYTSRQQIAGADARDSLEIGSLISKSLVSCVRRLTCRPCYLVVKGGITSSDVATKALGVKRALVLGQILPGVPVWQLGEESVYPDLRYIIFPGNVGGSNALVEIIEGLRETDK
jgi:uncharacterized protein YgbK (DUF1537 family)